MTTDQLLEAAAENHDAGRLAEAEKLYREVLDRAPDHADALHYLGLLCFQSGRIDDALELLERAVRSRGNDLELHIAYARMLAAAGRKDALVAAWKRALQARPEAIEIYYALTMALRDLGRSDEALEIARRAVELRPDSAPAQTNLGLLLQEGGQVEPAIEAYRRAIELNPKLPEPYNNLAILLQKLGRSAESIDVCQAVLAIAPEFADAWNTLGNTMHDQKRYDESISAYRKVLALSPGHPGALNNLGYVLSMVGQATGAMDCFARSLSIRLDQEVFANRLYIMWFDSRYDAPAILREHREWNDQYARPLSKEARPPTNDRKSDRRLRVGYISPFLGQTTVGWNLFPLLVHHDRNQFEVFCYSNLRRPDEMTRRLASRADAWRDTPDLSDAQIAEMIRADAIDILVDLSVHTPGNRLLVFARRPAPVQVTYLGYCGTTGMDAMDYRLSDPYFDPPGSEPGRYSERTVRLPRCYWCYEPGGPLAEVGPSPAQATGQITFASMNQFSKASPAARDLWLNVLLAVPGSRFLIHSPPGSHRAELQESFGRSGVAAGRIEFVGHQSWARYIDTFNRVDVALDSIPNNGGITSLDALMMGVPVVTLRGETSVGRAGCSILNNIGLPELVAETADVYVKIAAGLAGDLPRLSALRAGMRDRVERSPLRDAKGFTCDLEAAYRWMWHEWCAV